jgi:hypothetical protein
VPAVGDGEAQPAAGLTVGDEAVQAHAPSLGLDLYDALGRSSAPAWRSSPPQTMMVWRSSAPSDQRHTGAMWLTAPDCDRRAELAALGTAAQRSGGAHLPQLQPPSGARRPQKRWRIDAAHLTAPDCDCPMKLAALRCGGVPARCGSPTLTMTDAGRGA